MFSPGDTIPWRVPAHDPATDPPELATMDSMTGQLLRNGTDSGESVTVTEEATGEYLLEAAIPAGWSGGDSVQLRAAAAKGAVSDVTYSPVWRLGEATPSVDEIVVGVFGQVVEIGDGGRANVDFGEAISIVLAAAAGVTAGRGTGRMTVSGANTSATRITAERGVAGDREGVVLTPL